MTDVAQESSVRLFDMKRLVPHTEEEFDTLVRLLDAVLDAGGNEEDSPLSELTLALAGLVEDYEDIHYPDEDFS